MEKDAQDVLNHVKTMSVWILVSFHLPVLALHGERSIYVGVFPYTASLAVRFLIELFNFLPDASPALLAQSSFTGFTVTTPARGFRTLDDLRWYVELVIYS